MANNSNQLQATAKLFHYELRGLSPQRSCWEHSQLGEDVTSPIDEVRCRHALDNRLYQTTRYPLQSVDRGQ